MGDAAQWTDAALNRISRFLIIRAEVCMVWIAALWLIGGQAAAKPQPAPAFFTATTPVEEMRGKQAVVETSMGQVVIDLLPDAAPNHVAHFIMKAKEGAYDGTVFHRVIAMGIIQGGDPLSKDPAQRDKYGTGGLGVLRFEPNGEKHTRGAVSAVLVPGKRDSAGSQFFICVTDQTALDGQYTIFGRVVEGINTAQKISTAPADARSAPVDRIEITRVTIRDKPAATVEPFSTETVEQLAASRAVIETSIGNITVAFYPDRAPNHVRNFLRLASAGVYDGTAFHRIARGFVVQGGHLPTRKEPLSETQQGYVRNLQPEFNPTPHDKGILSMARLDAPDSANTSFFIVTARTPALDNKYTVFGHVVEGMDVVEKMEQVPVNGETPVTRIEVTRVTVRR
jgi:peptidyl-prolyl cis-trans isomerase B (cyclophilin B)